MEMFSLLLGRAFLLLFPNQWIMPLITLAPASISSSGLNAKVKGKNPPQLNQSLQLPPVTPAPGQNHLEKFHAEADGLILSQKDAGAAGDALGDKKSTTGYRRTVQTTTKVELQR
ncbi:hypothetical protein CIRG_09419 [Coccidioides immitis RMSCC 2394]|uniref:Uncharacterized protein n=1 Tax=Coccidioides immitis RMSCC 2394 TaxID=404692 RepID=A0A0J6YPV7_COCIT|nr:hypothetical protein CIRG_09419 [Coccidioides immitis RMSCC 2394]